MTLYPDDIPAQFAMQSLWDENTRLPRITVSINRTLPSILRDIARRLVEPAQAPIARRRAMAAQDRQYHDARKTLTQQVREFAPMLRITEGEYATVFSTIADGVVHLDGRIHGNAVTIDRIGSLTVAQFKAVCAALFGVGGGEG